LQASVSLWLNVSEHSYCLSARGVKADFFHFAPYIMEYYAARNNQMMSFAGKWMELEIITLSEISHTQKDKFCMLYM
jgi:hypothetical protein